MDSDDDDLVISEITSDDIDALKEYYNNIEDMALSVISKVHNVIEILNNKQLDKLQDGNNMVRRTITSLSCNNQWSMKDLIEDAKDLRKRQEEHNEKMRLWDLDIKSKTLEQKQRHEAADKELEQLMEDIRYNERLALDWKKQKHEENKEKKEEMDWNSLVNNDKVMIHFEIDDENNEQWLRIRDSYDSLRINNFNAAWACFCKFPQNKALVLDNLYDLCTKDKLKRVLLTRKHHNPRVMLACIQGREWTMEEVEDIGNAFKQLVEHKIGTDAHDARIVQAQTDINKIEEDFINAGKSLSDLQDLQDDPISKRAYEVLRMMRDAPGYAHVDVKMVIQGD